jgi:hypothetical protein
MKAYFAQHLTFFALAQFIYILQSGPSNLRLALCIFLTVYKFRLPPSLSRKPDPALLVLEENDSKSGMLPFDSLVAYRYYWYFYLLAHAAVI